MRDAEPAPGRRRPAWALPRRVAAAAAVAMLAALAMAGCAARAGASPSIELATAYVLIRNNGNADRLVAAHTSVGGRVTFRTARGPGAAIMSTVASVRVPAHGTLAMRPDGVHMVITGAGPMHGGKDITLTLVFAHAGRVSVVAQVTNPQSGGSSYFLN